MGEVEELITQVAKEHNISKAKATEAVMSQFKYLRATMESGEFKSVQLRYFGKFEVTNKKKNILNEE